MKQDRHHKKSETIEVRIPYPTKSAFMSKARSEGRAASDIVRERINAYLGEPEKVADAPFAPRTPKRAWRYVAGFAAILVASVGFVAFTGSASPAHPEPQLREAFAALDTNGDGLVKREEFVAPKRAHEIDIRGTQAGLEQTLSIGRPGMADYVRYILTTKGGDVALLIAIEPPEGPAGDDQVAGAVGKSFDRLDRNGDGELAMDEFLAR